jgi:Flp pilus assembly protein TadD
MISLSNNYVASRKKKARIAAAIIFGLILCLSAVISHRNRNRQLAHEYITKSGTFYDEGDYARAAQEARKSVRLDPEWATAHSILGYDLFRSGSVTEGTAEVRRAVKMDPDYQAARNNLGYMLFEQGDLNGSLDQFNASLAIDPKDAEATAEIGRIMAKQGRIKDALAQEDAALGMDKYDAVVLRCLGYVLYLSGDKAGAKKKWLACIDIGNRDVADQARAYIKQYNL